MTRTFIKSCTCSSLPKNFPWLLRVPSLCGCQRVDVPGTAPSKRWKKVMAEDPGFLALGVEQFGVCSHPPWSSQWYWAPVACPRTCAVLAMKCPPKGWCVKGLPPTQCSVVGGFRKWLDGEGYDLDGFINWGHYWEVVETGRWWKLGVVA
jgi:hypothetical protein